MKTTLRKIFYLLVLCLVVFLVAAIFVDAPVSYELTEIPAANPLVRK